MSDISAREIVVFLDAGASARSRLERIVSALRFRFGNEPPITIAHALEEGLCQEAAKHGAQVADPKNAVARNADVWVIALSFIPVFEGLGGWERVPIPGDKRTRAQKRLYVLEPEGFLHPAQLTKSGQLDAPMSREADPHLTRHVFSRLCPQNYRGQAYLFPYNGYYTGHPSAFGPIDSFGFRNAAGPDTFSKRETDHVVVAVFGASSTWSPCCLQNETFCSVLQERLRDYLVGHAGAVRNISVLNFGVSGHTVLNQLITYLLFCHRLKPEIVITHDLFADLANGVQTDPELLNKHDMTYMSSMEQWARTLMGTANVPLTQSDDPNESARMVNGPQSVVRAYLARKRQFLEIVNGLGGHFLYGIQPAWFAKALSEQEKIRLAKIRKTAAKSIPWYDLMPQLYSMTRDALAQNPPMHFVDVHTAFADLGPQDDVFYDHAHLLPSGDRKVADVYFREIVEQVLPKIESERRV